MWSFHSLGHQVGLAMAARALLRERARVVALGSGAATPSVAPSTGSFPAGQEAGIDNGNAIAAEAEFVIKCLRSLTAFYPGLRTYCCAISILFFFRLTSFSSLYSLNMLFETPTDPRSFSFNCGFFLFLLARGLIGSARANWVTGDNVHGPSFYVLTSYGSLWNAVNVGALAKRKLRGNCGIHISRSRRSSYRSGVVCSRFGITTSRSHLSLLLHPKALTERATWTIFPPMSFWPFSRHVEPQNFFE